MTWAEFNAARQFIAEERIGARVRQTAAIEDGAFAAAAAALSK
jgi:hypothetical protein